MTDDTVNIRDFDNIFSYRDTGVVACGSCDVLPHKSGGNIPEN